MKLQFDNTVCFSCSTDQRLPSLSPDALPALRRTPQVGKFSQSMTVARQTDRYDYRLTEHK